MSSVRETMDAPDAASCGLDDAALAVGDSPAAQAVAVIVPCCNEEASLPQLFGALERLLTRHGQRYDFEFVLVDDGSRDRTWEMLQAAARGSGRMRALRHETNRGIAAAIATGVRAAEADIVCSMDADCTYDPEQLVTMLPMLTDDVDLVTASPYHPQGRVLNVPAWRLTLSRGAASLYRLVARHKLYTYTSCFRVYRRSFIVDLPPENDGFAGVAELLWNVERRGGRIVECPATLDVRRYGQSKIRLAQVIAGHLRLLTRLAISRAFSPRFAHRPTKQVRAFDESKPAASAPCP